LQPDECFKIDAKPDWLSGYSVKFTPRNTGVEWAENIDWFEDLEYDTVTFAAADVVTDICDVLFVDEVERAFEDAWETDAFDLRDSDSITGGDQGGDAYVTNWKVGPGDLDGHRFKTLWFDDDLDGDFLVEDDDKDLTAFVLKGANDLYDEAGVTTNVTQIWQSIVDKDNDPTLDDFGKVDLEGDDPDTETEETDVPDGEADNMTGYQADNKECSMADNGEDQDEACDAMFEETFPVSFTSFTFGCEIIVDVTVTCEWDSQGGLVDGETPTDLSDTTINSFANCTAEMN
jgi:hypothetical protein